MMMWSAFTSEWTKLRRPTLFYSTFLGLAAASSLFVILMFSQATAYGGIVTLHQLAQPNGLVIGVARASMLLGVVAFGIAAAQIASEYSLGTLRQLLVRQPRRAVLLSGKMLGVVTFLIGALCFAGVVALVVAVLAAGSRHVPTHAWFTGTGLEDLFRELGDLVLAVIGYSVLGLAIGMFVRSAVFAVIIGFAWLVAVENIITRIVPSVQQWLPGASITAVASAGGEGVGYAHGLILSGVYLVVAIGATTVVFLRRDVTA
jgi:ABC-2 type transport system permease protein